MRPDVIGTVPDAVVVAMSARHRRALLGVGRVENRGPRLRAERCLAWRHLPNMTDNASPTGWVVRVTTKRPGRIPSVEIYDAAIPDAVDAVEAVRKACGAGPGTIIETVAELPAGTDLRDGEVLLR